MIVKLTLTDMNDVATLDDLFDGSIEVLEDDGEGDSPKAQDYHAVCNLIRAEVLRRYPVAFPAVFTLELSGEEATCLREAVADQLAWDNEFHASVVDVTDGGPEASIAAWVFHPETPTSLPTWELIVRGDRSLLPRLEVQATMGPPERDGDTYEVYQVADSLSFVGQADTLEAAQDVALHYFNDHHSA